MKIATWNVNSVKARLDTVRTWLAQAAPEIVCLQEIKTTDEGFPADVFEGLGYNAVVHGQKSYNGVAILSKRPAEDVVRGLPEAEGDDHARYIEAVIPGDSELDLGLSDEASPGLLRTPSDSEFSYVVMPMRL